MPLPSVIAAIPDAHRDTVRLVFDDRSTGEYSVRGGIAWPSLTSDSEHRSLSGCALVCGLNVASDTVVVFEHAEFNSISPQIRDTRLVNRPLTPILARWAATYLCQRYYWSDKGEVHSVFRRWVYQADDLVAKPALIEVGIEDPAAAMHVVWLSASGGRLKLQKDLYDAVRAGDADQEAPTNPAKHALLCALIGYQRSPWGPPTHERPWEPT